MIIWFGEEDSRRRMIKVNWLKVHFSESEVKPLHSLTTESLKDNRSYLTKLIGTQEKLVISGHGNDHSFMGMTAETLFDTLIGKGLNDDRFSSIHLLACNIGHAEQDNSVTDNFLRQFGRSCKVNDSTSNIKVYGPRGRISWKFKTEQKLGMSYETIESVKIKLRNHDGSVRESYEFSSGMLLYSL